MDMWPALAKFGQWRTHGQNCSCNASVSQGLSHAFAGLLLFFARGVDISADDEAAR